MKNSNNQNNLNAKYKESINYSKIKFNNNVKKMAEEFNPDDNESEMNDTGDEFDEYDNYSSEDIASEKEDVELGRESYSRIEIDLYKTKMHGAMVGVRQQAQYMSKSRQFTKNTEVVGEVTYFYGYEEEKERDGYKEVITINEFFWETEKKSQLYKKAKEEFKDYDPAKYSKLMRKAVIKSFIGLDKNRVENKGRWTGSIEESQIFSLALTFGEKDPLPLFFVNLPGYKYRIPIFRTHAVTGERYVFPLVEAETGIVTPFYIEGKRFTPGSDYSVFNPCTMETVAKIDDRSLNVGGKVDIQLYEEFDDLNRNKVFRRILILFSVLSKYLAEICDTYKTIHRALTAQKGYKKDLGKADDPASVNEKYKKAMQKMKFLKNYTVSPHELSLHYNPRRVRT